MLVRDRVDEWLRRIDESDRAIGTKQQYAKIDRSTVVPAMGELRVSEIRPSVCDAALRKINQQRGYSVAKTSPRLCQVRSGSLYARGGSGREPVRDAERLTRGDTVPKRARVLTEPQTGDLLTLLDTHPRAHDLDLLDLVAFMLMTGCRIGGALALREGTNLDGDPLVRSRTSSATRGCR